MTVVLERGLKEVNQIEVKIQRESAHILDQVLEQRLEEVLKIEAKLQTEAWTVVTKMDTIMLRNWLNEASKFKEYMNKTVAYRKSGRLDWETHQIKLETVVNRNGASAPQPVQLAFAHPYVKHGSKAS